MRLKQRVLAVLAVGLAACGGVAKEDFGTQVTEALCERYTRCGYYASTEACERDWPQVASRDRFDLGTRYDEALASGRLSYDEDAAERCVESLRDGDCRLPALSRTAMFEGLEYDPACQVLRVEEPATDCQLNLECGAHGFCAYSASNACQGRCEPRAREGETVFRADACEPGLVAFIGGICSVLEPCDEPQGVCERVVEEGGSCINDLGDGRWRYLQCADGLWCDGQGTGVCKRTLSEGEACEAIWGPPCDSLLTCKEGVCARYAREGEHCTGREPSSLLFSDECQRGLFCDADASESGTCRKPRAEGEPCRLSSSQECADNMGCYAAAQGDAWGTCGKRPGLGAACDTSALLADCAPGLTCSRTLARCVPLVQVGEPCGVRGECAWGSECSDEGRCLPFEAARCG
jgi:hypothetical protein